MSDKKEVKNIDMDKVNDQRDKTTAYTMSTGSDVTNVLAENPNYEGATNQTTNFKLPLYQRGDNFKVLTDHNIAMSIIDNALAGISDDGAGYEQKINQLTTTLTTLRNSHNTLKSTVTNISGHINDIDETINTIPNIQNDLISQNNLIKALTTRVLALEDGQATANHEIGEIKRNSTSYRDRITSLEKNIKGGMTTITGLTSKQTIGFAVPDTVNSEKSKYLITLYGQNTNSTDSVPYIKQWYSGTRIMSFGGGNNVALNAETVPISLKYELKATITTSISDGMRHVNCAVEPINGGIGSWDLLLTAIPIK